ncbi:unnamed protein product [Linum trigynum]|uniref:anthocyanidin 3-O-glucosyltransferase n=1 Tax=Linum trigynum TaxID=586398 RepID=A0AAV2G1D3_9ROSI
MGRTSNTGGSGGHVILLPYPGQGHVNPMIHFTTVYLSNAANLGHTIGRSVHHDVISDGFDDTGRNADGGRPLNDYLERMQEGLLKLPVNSWPVSVPGLPLLHARDVPSFADDPTSTYLDLLGMLVVDILSKVYPILTIGPTVPSNDDDEEYGLDLFRHDASISTDWVATKPPSSVVYVAFGSMAKFTHAQMEELALGLKQTNYYFLWVIRDAEQAKLPQTFLENLGDKALVVSWSPQVKVLASEVVGCFVTHSGWNSTVEALSLGVPMVAMPIWSDQPMNAFLVENVWKVGKRVKADEEGEGNEGIVGRDEVERCLLGGGGSSFRNIDEFVAKVMCYYSNNRCRSDV